MPLYEYKCSEGHKTIRVVHGDLTHEPKESTTCKVPIDPKEIACGLRAILVPSLTGKPILKAGIGGFYAPNAR